MSEYKRSLDELREIYLQDALPGELESEGRMFDEAIRAIRAEAWDEAVEWAAEHARQIKAWRATGGHYTPDHEDEYNPYRDEADA